MNRFVLMVLLGSVLMVSACASQPHTHFHEGGVPVISTPDRQSGSDKAPGKGIDSALSALPPSAVDRYMKQQHRALEAGLALVQMRTSLYITHIGDHALRVGLSGAKFFPEDSAELSTPTKRALQQIAGVIKQYEKTVVHIVGHTDSRGAAAYNQKLSENRAEAVAAYLVSQGVDPARLMTAGRGESEPIASNETKAGRARNRRVDIVIKPIIEGSEQKAVMPPPYLGS